MLLLASILAIAAFHLIGLIFFNGFALDLGSVVLPTRRYLSAVELWILLGGFASVSLTYSTLIGYGSSPRVRRLLDLLVSPASRSFIFLAAGLAILVPCVLRLYVLHEAPLTDDEGAYRFAAQLLATGRLSVPSPPLKLFFDQNFMINDGRLYPAYFLGWPSLLAIGISLGSPGLVNPVLSALTVPALARLVARLAGPEFVRVALVVFLCSPFIQVAAATELSHTACLAALTWAFWLYFRFRDGDSRWTTLAALAGCLGGAFWIRPQATTPLAFPIVVATILQMTRSQKRVKGRDLIAFSIPLVSLALLFLAALWGQTGSPWTTGYRRYGNYMIENDFRFATFNINDLTTVVGFAVFSIVGIALRTLSAVVRLNADLFGWPCSLGLLGLAFCSWKNGVHLIWASLGIGFVTLVLQRDLGIDTFGPVHAFELALPITLLTMVGAARIGRLAVPYASRLALQTASKSTVGACFLLLTVAVSLVGFIPVRLRAIHQIGEQISGALRAPQEQGLSRSVIFAPFPFVPRCAGDPAHFVFFRPPNDPDLLNDVLWVNDLGDTEDSKLLERLPGRSAYILEWSSDCKPAVRPMK